MIKVFLVMYALISGVAPEEKSREVKDAAECASAVANLTAQEVGHEHPVGSRIMYACIVEFVKPDTGA